jgi:hypothetical protein
MSLISFAKLPLTADEGWPQLAGLHAGILRIFLLLVLPLSLLPPVMLYYAGTHYPEVLWQVAGAKDWTQVAAVFFVAEWSTYLLMGWLISQVAATYALPIGPRDAYLLAAIAAAPLWLSSLALLVPDRAFNAAASAVALALSCAVLYQGVQALGQTREKLIATEVTQIVMGAGLIAWALLLVLAVL